MATGSIITIANRSLGGISARAQIQSLNEGTPESNAVNTFYQSTFEAVARSARWGCLKKQVPLTLLAGAPGTPVNFNGNIVPYPPNPWLYTYQVPGDSLFVRALVPPRPVNQSGSGVPIFPTNNYVGAGGQGRRQIPYEIGYWQNAMGNNIEVINTNLGGAEGIYTVNQPDPTYWDSLLQQAVVSALGVFLCYALSGDKAMGQAQKAFAQDCIDRARAMDGNENPTTQDREASWISARNGESGPWSLGFNTSYLNYEVPWPVW